MPLHITILYAGLNGLLVLGLALHVSRVRREVGIGLGTGDNEPLTRAARIHGNAVEYIPLVLILMGLLELQHAPAPVLHGIGIALTLGRLLHVWGLALRSGVSFGRAAGMALTWASLFIASLAALLAGLGQV